MLKAAAAAALYNNDANADATKAVRYWKQNNIAAGFSSQHECSRRTTSQTRCFCTSSSSSEAESFDKLSDLDTSKLPRLFVGNWDRTRQISSQQGICAAFQDALTAKTFSTSSSLLAPDALVHLNSEQSHYLTTVLRLGKKSKAVPYVRLFDDSGEEWLAKISVPTNSKQRNSDPLQAVCIQRTRQSKEQMGCCWLVVAPTKKKDRVRWMIEKCTELNVAGFVLLDTEFSEAPSSSLSKLQSYAIEAAEQSERMSVPAFLLVRDEEEEENAQRNDKSTTSLENFLTAWEMDAHKVSLAICRERSDQAFPLGEYLSSILSPSPSASDRVIAFIVGPEGGWSPNETEMFDQIIANHDSSCAAVSLGSTILRSETACMLAVGAFALDVDRTRRPISEV